MAGVSVIIVTWNSAAYIVPCIESLRKHHGAEDVEIIVADNGSSDETCALVATHAPDVTLLRFNANLGFPRANNLAAKRARGDYLFFLNPDTHLDNDAISLLRARLEEVPALGIVGPGIVSEKGVSIAVDARSFPTLRGTAFRYLGLRSLFPHHPIFGSAYLHPAKRNCPQYVDCLTGAAMLVETSFFYELGGFDEQLPMYFEDLDLCGRTLDAGRQCGFVPNAHVTHFGGESTALSPISRFLLALEDGQAPWMYFSRYRSQGTARLFTMTLATGNLFRILLYVLSAPLALHPRFRPKLTRRVMESMTLLRWCCTSKEACMAKAQALFDQEPRYDDATVMESPGHGA